MTAVNWMIEELIKKHVGKVGNEYVEIFEQAKQLEKQEIMDAYKVGNIEGYYTAREYNDLIKYEDSEQYYNETYGSKESDDHIVDTNEMVEDTFKVWECCGMEECICKGSDETKTK